jgi:hypothetical protein
MRLTLRTLLAWLDDTLSPGEVREIGKQVSESQYAQDLVERIQRVTRQRRLTVPSNNAPDADPNLVASYLDNELDQDLVPEYEKLCLTSDVHMAEVASVHQILSLIGQKAKVPAEAKNRMYHLIRGREAIAPKRRHAEPSVPGPVSEPIGPWVTPPPPSRPWLSRFGPAALAIGLIGVLAWSAWMSLHVGPQHAVEFAGVGPVAPTDAGAAATPSVAPAPAPNTIPALAPGPESTPAMNLPGAPPKAEQASATPKEAEPAKEATPGTGTGPRTEYAPGVLGKAEKPDGVLLRYDPEGRVWTQIADPIELKRDDHLLSLDPYRSSITLGSASARVDLVGETELLLATALPSQAGRFQFAQGRVVLHGPPSSVPFEVQFAGKGIQITPPPGGVVGVERISRFEPGNKESAGSVLRVYSAEGEVALSVDNAQETLSSPGSIVWDGSKWTDRSDRPPPSWVTDTKPTAFEKQIGDQFLQYMRPNRPVITNIVEAHDDEQKDVRRLSLRALRAVGDLAYITPDLNKPDDPTARREAIRVLRAALAQGPDSIKVVSDQLVRDFGEDQARILDKLLTGYTAKEARDDATYTTLVKYLAAPDVGVRELALDNLRTLTGRDDLEYDADKFETGRGLNAWRELLKNHDLRPPAASGKTEK